MPARNSPANNEYQKSPTMPPSAQRLPRRSFLGATGAATTGLALAGLPASPAQAETAGVEGRASRLPREVWIATISQDGLRARNTEEMSGLMLERMNSIRSFKPDLVCLPELFQFSNTDEGRPPVSEVAETPLGSVGRPFAEFARMNQCYVLYTTYTKENGNYYNSAVLIDRQGKPAGVYHKMHPTSGEITDRGLTPGPLDPPVFDTDFGRLGAQICFDIEWDDGWKKLAEKGAEIVVWTSAFAGGSAVNAKAWQNQYVVVSTCRKDTSKICDITGEVVAATGRWNSAACAPINLEKAFLHTWPFNRRFDEIQAKYGRDLRITNFHEEEWTILESRSPDLKIADVLKEFEIDTYRQLIAKAGRLQQQARGQVT